jgi:hypothetical protein
MTDPPMKVVLIFLSKFVFPNYRLVLSLAKNG